MAKEAREDLADEALVGIDDEGLARRIPHDTVRVALRVRHEVVQLGDEGLDARGESDRPFDDVLRERQRETEEGKQAAGV